MNNATFLSVQLNADDFSGSSGLVELLNRHLLFATDVAEGPMRSSSWRASRI